MKKYNYENAMISAIYYNLQHENLLDKLRGMRPAGSRVAFIKKCLRVLNLQEELTGERFGYRYQTDEEIRDKYLRGNIQVVFKKLLERGMVETMQEFVCLTEQLGAGYIDSMMRTAVMDDAIKTVANCVFYGNDMEIWILQEWEEQ